MPRVFDNIELPLLPALCNSLAQSQRADFCIGYFNLRGWRQIDHLVEPWAGDDFSRCRVLVGMQELPDQELRRALSLAKAQDELDNSTAVRLKRRMAEEFRLQLTVGAPNVADEQGLRRLSAQLKAGKVIVKLHLEHLLHAKLYLCYRDDHDNPITGYVGSSNLTFSGLRGQGELNVDVLDQDACRKLQKWFDDRWHNRWSLDITKELIEAIDESWAREKPVPPYHIYLKMAYHLSQEARAGLDEFSIPKNFAKQLLEYQTAAVKIAAHHVNRRGGVLIGDVVGLGKTIMAAAVARIFEEDVESNTLIICPKNLEKMWLKYVDDYKLRARVLPLSKVDEVTLKALPRFYLIVIDESHNLRNREGKRYKAIQDYIKRNASRCLLLTATPYNKTQLDLSSQLRLFVPEDKDLGVRPERYLLSIGGDDAFSVLHQGSSTSLAAFEKSVFVDDWRNLMRLYMVRRTRSFIQRNYGTLDPVKGQRYLTLSDGRRSYFPQRMPINLKFEVDPQYARLYSDGVVDTINSLILPRYGLVQHLDDKEAKKAKDDEATLLAGLTRAGQRLKGFTRTNLFKRLESSGSSFILSLERHILRNCVFLYALEQGKPLPIGSQGAELLDLFTTDRDDDPLLTDNDEGDDVTDPSASVGQPLRREAEFRQRAAQIYALYDGKFKRRFKWLRPGFFKPSLAKALQHDVNSLLALLQKAGDWQPELDAKIERLHAMLTGKHAQDKVLIFTQFADTAEYVAAQLEARKLKGLACVTGAAKDPTGYAWRFSPQSNNQQELAAKEGELRVLVATDVLSEGQNLQDCSVIINYDLPWAIIRLIQRAGRVDRIGQMADKIACYSFIPAAGVEEIIKLRQRLSDRLHANAEVVGSDETFFEDEADRAVIELYNEQSGILDPSDDDEVDLASYAYQIWKNAIAADPTLEGKVKKLPAVAYSTKAHTGSGEQPQGVLVYTRTADGGDVLAWVDQEGKVIKQSPFEVLRAAECTAAEAQAPRDPRHHDLVLAGVAEIIKERSSNTEGQLGRITSARRRTYERLKAHRDQLKQQGQQWPELERAMETLYRHPLLKNTNDALNRQLRSGISVPELAALVVRLYEDDNLAIINEQHDEQEPQIICSLGLFAGDSGVD